MSTVTHTLRALAVVASLTVALFVAGCASNRVISEGPHRNLMLKGRDPVAYFTMGKPVPGKVEIALTHDGLDYRFVSEEHRRMFVATPERFVPKYGGFCSQGAAYAVMFGGEPENFQIINDRLHIYGDGGAMKAWNSSPQKHLEYAEHYWNTEMKGTWYVLQTAKRMTFKVPHYKSGSQVQERLAAGKPVLE